MDTLKGLLEQLELEAEPGKIARPKYSNQLIVDNTSFTGTWTISYPQLVISNDGTLSTRKSASHPVTSVNVFDMMKRIEELERKLNERAPATSSEGSKA